MPENLTRRGILAAGGALGITALLAACGDDKSGGSDSGAAKETKKDGPWSFKDDRGETAQKPTAPKNIVAFTGTAAALHDYGVEVKGVFGPTKTADGKADVQAGDLDVNKVEIIGNVWGEFNIEKYAALAPEVLITGMYDKGALWYVPDESKDKILKLAPSVALMVARETMPKVLERHAQLAESLGADLKSTAVADARTRFEKAAEELRSAAKSNPGVKVLIASGSADILYISTPELSADLLYFQELGVEIVVPDREKLDEGGWFESLSWENADKYAADVILLDNRTGTLQTDQLKDKPTWAKLPAVAAGQVVPRVTEPVFSYDKCAPILEDLAKTILAAKKVS
ncbi:ABC transporter substrate-binding protein [Streptomyces sp. NPDC051940]|uniref:ABC transporter substrate-binding protein n=1 Tax=Streptomyces sp. NPDC051940 TaxID=3155675 RepID=UPI00342B7CF0